MKVLVPLPFDLTNLAHGRNLRIVHLLRELGCECEITCLTPETRLAFGAQDQLPNVRVEAIGEQSDGQETIANDMSMPLGLRQAFSFIGYVPELVAHVCRRAADFDAVLGFDLPSVIYLLAAVRAGKSASRPRVVGDLIDDPWLLRKSLSWRRRWSPTGWKTALSITRIRRHVLPELDALVAVGPLDANSLSAATGRPVQVVTNGVQVRPIMAGSTEPLVVFSGAMDFPPNETAAVYLARRIWPLVWRRWQENRDRADSDDASTIRLAIVGGNPTTRVRALAKIPGVIVTGYVTDMSAWLARARVAVAPMVSGSGIKNKVLEACAAGCPVVSTSLGAAALPVGQEQGVFVEDRPDTFAAQVHALLVDARTARVSGLAARSMVAREFSWSRMAVRLLAVLAGENPVESHRMATFSTEGRSPSEKASYEEAFAHAAS